MDSIIKSINEFLEETSNRKGLEPLEVLMDLAMIAGIYGFNPYRSADYELREIASAIPDYIAEEQ